MASSQHQQIRHTPAHSNPVTNESSIFYSWRCPPRPPVSTKHLINSKSFYPIVLRRIRGGWIFREGGTGGFVKQILEKCQFLVFDTVLGFTRLAVAFHAMNFHSTKRSRRGVTSVKEITKLHRLLFFYHRDFCCSLWMFLFFFLSS